MPETIITDISQTTFNREVNKVLSEGTSKTFYKWKAQLIADKNKVIVYYVLEFILSEYRYYLLKNSTKSV